MPGIEDVPGEQVLAVEQGANAEENVPGELGLLAGESTREVVGGDVLVHRVCFDVLVEELGRVRTLAESVSGQGLA